MNFTDNLLVINKIMWGTGIQGYKGTRLQGCKVAKLQGYRVTRQMKSVETDGNR